MAAAPETAALLAKSPTLATWLGRMTSRPSAQRTTMAVLRAALEPQAA
jgi:hypothetical protein